jgi:hypothetical protein
MDEPIQVGDATSGRRRVLVLVGIAVAVLAGVVVLPGLLFGGGASTPTEEAFPPVEVESVSPSTTAVAGDAPPETVQAFTSKNPFRPLVDTTPAPEATAGEAVVDPTTATTLPFESDFFFPEDDFVVPDENAPIAPDPTPDAPPVTAPPRPPDRVSLLEVFTDPGGQLVASVRVNDITYQVTETSDFAVLYRLVDLDAGRRCAQLLFGDAPFGLCEGDEVIK